MSKFLFVSIVLVLVLSSCHPSDNTIKADLSTKAMSQKEFAGVRFTVENGVVKLDGSCATDKDKTTVMTTTQNLYGVKKVDDHLTIAPVVIGTDALLKQRVDSTLKTYAGVQAVTQDSMVLLEGKVPKTQLNELLTSINQLHPKSVTATVTPY